MESQMNSGCCSCLAEGRSPRWVTPENTSTVLSPYRRPNNMSVFSLGGDIMHSSRLCLDGDRTTLVY